MRKAIARTHPISEELLDPDLELLQKAVVTRRSHLRSIDELAHRDVPRKAKSKCPTKKHRYRDNKEAIKVLHSIHNSRLRAAEEGRTYHFRQVGHYMCNCKAVHLTSQKKSQLIVTGVNLVA